MKRLIKMSTGVICVHKDTCLQEYYNRLRRHILYGTRNELLNCPDCEKCTRFEKKGD